MKNLPRFLLISLAPWFFACGQNEESSNQTQEVHNSVTKPVVEETDNVQKLKDVAIDKDDIFGRISSGIYTLDGEFDKSENLMPELGKVKVTIDENCLLVIRNERDGNTFETRVNLTDLDTKPGAVRLIADVEEGSFPGISFSTINQEAVVEIWKNGKVITKDNALEIHLATRENIEKIAPALLQTIRLCKEGD